MRPIPADDFSNLVGSIYDCALDPALWSARSRRSRGDALPHLAASRFTKSPSGRLLLDVQSGDRRGATWSALRLAGPSARAWGGAAAR